MNFLQRRGHYFKWISIAFILAMGFINVAFIFIEKQKTASDENIYLSDDSFTLDSIYIQQYDIHLKTKQVFSETYLEVVVNQAIPYTVLNVYHENKLIGFVESKGINIVNYKKEKIKDLKFHDPILNMELFKVD